MKLIFALGNPEKKYTGTRHNAGFFVADLLAEHYASDYTEKSKFKAHIAETIIHGQKVIIAKPTTYYNLVGESARAIIDFYKIHTDDVLIIHDELSLPFGVLRIRQGGSDAGNNGIKSLNSHLDLQTWRLRIGISNEHTAVIGAHAFVLGLFSATEQAHLTHHRRDCIEIIERFIQGELANTTVDTRDRTSDL